MNDIIKNISFKKKPIPIPPEYRPLYKIGQIVIMIKYACIGNKTGLLKLHLLSWAFRSRDNRETLLSFLKGDISSDFFWGIEPTLNKALQIAIIEKICLYKNKKYHLTEKGFEFAEIIERDNDIFKEEKEFLKLIGKRSLSDNKLKSISDKWALFNDTN